MKAPFSPTGALLAALASVLLIAGCGGAASRLASHVQRGKDYFDKGDFTHASIEFRNALQIAPKNPEVMLLAGRTAEKLGKVRDAAGLYQALVDAAPDDVQGRANLGRLYAMAHAPDKALELVKAALVKHPDEPDLLAVRALVRLEQKDPKGARADAERAVQLAPLNENAVGLLAGIDREEQDPAAAVTLLTSTLQKLPASTDLREILADVYAGVDDLPKAEEQLRKLVELKPHEFAYRYQLALFYVRSHNMDAAQRAYEQAVAALPDSDDAKLALVNFLTTQRTREQAEQTLRKYIQANPDKYELRLGLGALLTRAGATKDAIVAYKEVIARDPNGPSGVVARDRLARLYVAQNQLDDAQKLIAEVLQKSPRDDDALLLRGQLELARNDATAAIGDLRAVIRDQPGAIPVRQLLAQAYQVNNQAGLAEEQLRAAMEVAPTNTAVRLELSRVLLRTQRAEQAVTLLKESVQRQPKDSALREGLVQAYLAIHNAESAQTAANDLKILAPEDPLGPYLAGEVALAQGHPADAEKEFEHALELQPHALEPLSALTRVQIGRGESAQAIARLQQVLAKYPKDAQTLEMLGEVYLATRDYPHAIESFTNAIEFDANRWQAYRNLGVAKAATGDAAGAVAAYEAGIKIAPGQAGLVVELGSYYEKHGRIDDAITLYNGFYRRDPQSRLAANNLAMLLATYKRDRASLDRARDLSATFVSSDDGALLDTYGWVHFKRGEIQDAIPVVQRALTRAPDSKIIHYHLGMAELQSGQTASARANLETAVSGAANFAGVDEARTVLADLKRGGGAG